MELIGILWDGIIIKPMLNSLVLLYDLLFNNFGLSIIVFTIIIRAAMIPLTIRQTRQMRAMSSLQPRVKALQEKYKDKKDRDSRQKLSQETMALYKQAGVNPVGCLGPMVIQMPIWIGLYRSIFWAVPPTPEGMANLSGYLYSWNPSLGSIPLSSDFLGMNLVHLVQAAPQPYPFLLPILVGATMWVQQKMTTARSTDPRQSQTNQIMLWMMPVMFGFFTFQFPAGLAVYILFSNLVGIVIQYFVMGRPSFRDALGGMGSTVETAVADEEPLPATTEGRPADGDSAVLRQDRRRSNRPRSRDSRRKSRRRRDHNR